MQLSIPDWDRDQIDLISRWYRLRKMGLCRPLIHTGQLYTFDNPSDPWGSREFLSWEKLYDMVLEAELNLKKPIGRECNHYNDVAGEKRQGGQMA